MELKEFVKDTLVQIVTGVKEAQDVVKETNAEISPTGLRWQGGEQTPIIFKEGRGIVQIVEFDIALTATKGKSAQGGVKVFGGVINLGAKGKAEEAKAAANRIKFTVPILLPSKPYDWSKEQRE